MNRTTLLLATLLFTFASCKGQGRLPYTIGEVVSEMDKGIWYVFQDKKDNYWFCSDGQGVYQYDGKTIVHFSTKDGLANDRIRGVQEDNAGNIYINTLGGISKFDGQQFTTLPVVENTEWKSEPGDLWFITNQNENGTYRYDGKTLYHLKFPKNKMEDEFYKRLPNVGYNPYQVYTIYKDSKNNTWFGTSTFGIYRFDGKNLSWMYEDHLTHIGSEGSFGIRSIMEDKEGKFWFCNTSYRYNIESNEKETGLINYSKEKGIKIKSLDGTDLIYYQSIAKDNNDDLWMLTYGMGVWRYDAKSMKHYAVKDGGKDIKLISIYKDNKGGLWLGTLENGVYKFNGKEFLKFRPGKQ
jgi:ligand-binding sensor domain-containing protein